MKNLQNLGQALSKAEQKTINGGLKSCNHQGDPVCDNKSCCQPFRGGMYCLSIGYSGNGCLPAVDTLPTLP